MDICQKFFVQMLNIYNDIIFPSFNHAKIFDSIPDVHSHKAVRQLAKSHAQCLYQIRFSMSVKKKKMLIL